MANGVWSIMYQTSTGAFVCLTDNLVDPLPTGLAAKSVGVTKPDLNAYQWDSTTLGLVPRTPQRLITKNTYINRFTDLERRAFLGFPLDSTKTENQRKIIDAFRWYTGVYMDYINLDDPSIVAGTNFLETAGVLATGRAAQILS